MRRNHDINRIILNKMMNPYKHHIVKIGRFFYLMCWPGGLWFRFFGYYGLHLKDTNRNIELYSDQFRKFIKIGSWRITTLGRKF